MMVQSDKGHKYNMKYMFWQDIHNVLARTFDQDMKLRLPGTHAALIDKIRTPLHVSLNNSVTRQKYQTKH